MDTITLTPDEAARVLGVLLLLHHGKAAPLTGADAALLQQARQSLASQLGVPADMLPQGEGTATAPANVKTLWYLSSEHVSSECWENIRNNGGGVPNCTYMDEGHLVDLDPSMADYRELRTIIEMAVERGHLWLLMSDEAPLDPSVEVYDEREPEEDDE